MLLAQGRAWRATLDTGKAKATIRIGLQKETADEEQKEIREFRLNVPLDKWGQVVKHVRKDRKLLGGVVLELASNEDQLALVLGNDRLFGELQRVVIDATVALVECGALGMTPGDRS